MIFLLLSIVVSTLLFLLFKVFQKYDVNTFQAIVFNYIIASLLGYMLTDGNKNIIEIINEPWIFNAIIIGILFISLFNVAALTSQKIGVSVSSAANKMSVVIPVIVAFLFYGDKINALKIAGIIIALAGVYLTSVKDNSNVDKKLLYLPALLFIGSGILDAYMKYTQQFHLTESDSVYFIPTLFAVAAFCGSLILIYKVLFIKEHIQLKSLLWGTLLGTLNYFSVYFLLKTLENKDFGSSVIFPLNNIGILLASVLASYLFFREKLSRKNWLGISLCVIAIVFIGLSDISGV